MEELDSDDTDTQGVDVDGGRGRFFSDPLQFTGVDSAPKSRKAYAYQSDSESSGSEESDESNVSAAQVALRDKEEALVQSALARIRRAQDKGKLEVKLREDELAALENRRKRIQAAAALSRSKSKRDKGSGSERRKKKSSPPMVTVPIVQPDLQRSDSQRPASRRYSKQYQFEDSGPGMLVEGADGRMTYAPIDLRPPSSHHSSPSRPRSSSSLAYSQSHRFPPQQHPYGYPVPNRHVSDGGRPTSSASASTGPRPLLPHEEGWVPSDSRRNSMSSQYSHDPFEYQVRSGTPPLPSAEFGGRRYMSGPPDVQYSSVRRSLPGGAWLEGRQAGEMAGGREREREMERERERERRREVEVADEEERQERESSEQEESDERGNGVRVVPERVERRESVASSKKPARRKKKGRR